MFLLAACTRDNAAYDEGSGGGGATSVGEEGEGTRTDGADGTGPGSGSDEPVTDGDGSEPTAGESEGPVGLQDCCQPALVPGCNSNAELEDEVCAERPECCDVAWDPRCVELGALLGFDDCGVDTAACCAPTEAPGCEIGYVEECVCATDPVCCENGWHIGCVARAVEACVVVCELPSTCCFEHPGGGCDDPELQNCVCKMNGQCCGGLEWGPLCVDAAIECGGDCGG